MSLKTFKLSTSKITVLFVNFLLLFGGGGVVAHNERATLGRFVSSDFGEKATQRGGQRAGGTSAELLLKFGPNRCSQNYRSPAEILLKFCRSSARVRGFVGQNFGHQKVGQKSTL